MQFMEIWIKMGKIYSDLTNIRLDLIEKICMNEECKNNPYTKSRPLVLLADRCWFCKTNDFLENVI